MKRNWQALRSLTVASVKMYFRNVSALFFTLFLPVMLVLIFGNATTAQDLVEVVRVTLILTLTGLFITVMFVARNVWRTAASKERSST